ncbi:MAG TPA: serine/threonine-protein kinase, partial [Gemmatimonadales bacterium]|nr:serine/threonine-protein kinase [Gemmatimonadales bacterium]
MQALEAFTAALAGRYAVGNELGRGGMAVVYRAHDLRHDRPVALKAILPRGDDPRAGERFRREVRLTARLQHPNILPLHDSVEAAGVLWYAAPVVPGGSVRDRLNREARLPVVEALRLIRQVAAALQHAHAQGVVHRDIKPENVLLTAEGDALVADFGIATAVSAGGEVRLTATGMSLGTPAYMSPEQLGGEQVDARTDVYALGCLLHELLAGEPPHSAATPRAMLTRRMTEAPPPVSRLRSEVPPALDAVLVRALALQPADRTPSVATFLADLDA